MNDTERFRLLGTYTTPRLRIGAREMCAVRDCDLIVVAYSNGRIPWPLGRADGTSSRSLIVFGGLLEAVKRESNQALCHWFGVTPQTVSKWRKAIGVGVSNEGTHRLRHDYTEEEWLKDALRTAQAKATDPERRRKISAARKGKRRPAHVMKHAHDANRGRLPSAVTRQKMSKARAGRGRADLRPWTPADDELVRTLPPQEAAARTGRTLTAIYTRRNKLGLVDGRTTRHAQDNDGTRSTSPTA